MLLMYKFDTNNTDHISIRLWFQVWEKQVQNKDFEAAKKLFENDVVSFGTWMNVVEGLDKLYSDQWKNIWPTINNFKFVSNTLFIQISPDRLLANSILVWNSTGYKENGNSFKRNGRATVVLKRSNLDNSWKGIHTHFSLNRGIPQESFGKNK